MAYTKMAGKITLVQQLQLLLSMLDSNKTIVIDGLGFPAEIVEIGETQDQFVIEVKRVSD